MGVVIELSAKNRTFTQRKGARSLRKRMPTMLSVAADSTPTTDFHRPGRRISHTQSVALAAKVTMLITNLISPLYPVDRPIWSMT